MQRREIGSFLAVTFVLGFAAQLLAVRQGLSAGGGSLMLAMWAPAAGAMTSAASRKAAFASLRRSGGRWLFIGLPVGWALILLRSLVLWAFGGGAWNQASFPIESGAIAGVHKVAMVLGVGAQGFGWFATNLAVTLTLASLLLGAAGGLGEELGWRAVLQPEMERRFGPLRGSLAVGLVWAYWHRCFILNPRGWGWDNASILVAAGLVGGLFALLALRHRQGTPALLTPAFD